MLTKYQPELVTTVQKKVAGRHLAGFVPGSGPLHPRVALIGEAPGRQEVEQGRPFVGNSGQELTKMMALAGLRRQDVYITSVVRSRPFAIRHVQDKRSGKMVEKYPNRTPTKSEVRAFAPLFDWEIATRAPQILVPMGNTSLQRLLGPDKTVGQLHGQVLQTAILEANDDYGYKKSTQHYWVFPMYHPAAYLYARRLEATVKADWKKFGQWLKEHPVT